jgi:urate oxidase
MDIQPIAEVDLASNTYGKSRVRLMKLARHTDRHDLKEITFQILFRGDFASCYETGDNTKILPTDTIKNTVYALARHYEIVAIEEFAQRLIEHFLAKNPQVSEVRIEMTEHLWTRAAATTFTRAAEKRTALVTATRDTTSVEAGLDDLVILKSSDSAFEGYIKDAYTTLKETKDRIFATALRAKWLYEPRPLNYNATWDAIHQTLIDTFASHVSLSVQHTLHALGQRVLTRFSEVAEIQLIMPNKHALVANLAPFGLDNPNEVFIPTDEPSGYIEATLVRRAAVSQDK